MADRSKNGETRATNTANNMFRDDISSSIADRTTFSSNALPVQYKNAREYSQALQKWMWQYRMLQSFSMFQSHLMSTVTQNAYLQQTFPHQTALRSTVSDGNSHTPHPGTDNQSSEPQATGYKVPFLWRRIVAELLDFILLFYTKILVTVAVLRQMGYLGNDDLLDLDSRLNLFSDFTDFTELDFEKMFTLTSELIALEVINRLCVTFVETLCLRRGYNGSIGGSTPGKRIMHLRVISFDSVQQSGNRTIAVTGARDPGFFNALLRSVIKNFSMAFFFPASFSVFFFRYNRAAYDILANTIVVEVERDHQ